VSSVTRRVTRYVPGLVNVCSTVIPNSFGCPSPKAHSYDCIAFGPPLSDPLKFTVSGDTPVSTSAIIKAVRLS